MLRALALLRFLALGAEPRPDYLMIGCETCRIMVDILAEVHV